MNKQNEIKKYQELVYANRMVNQSEKSLSKAEKTMDFVEKLMSRALGTLPTLSSSEIFAPNERGEFMGNMISIDLRKKGLAEIAELARNNFNLQETADEIQTILLGYIQSNNVSSKTEDEIIDFGTEYIGGLEDRARDISFRVAPFQPEGLFSSVSAYMSEYLKPTKLKDIKPLDSDLIIALYKASKMPNGESAYDYYMTKFNLEHSQTMAKDFEKKKRPDEPPEDYSIYSK